MRFHRNAGAPTPESRSDCGLYRTRTLRPGLLVAERRWHPGEKPRHLYAPWRFIGFAKDERQARQFCRRDAGKSQDARVILRDLGLVALANDQRHEPMGASDGLVSRCVRSGKSEAFVRSNTPRRRIPPINRSTN